MMPTDSRRREGQEKPWENLSLGERRELVARLRRSIALAQEDVARTVATETRKPVTEVLSQEVTATLEMLRYFETRYPGRLRPRRFRCLRPGFWRKKNAVILEPLGTVALIGPANFPFSLPVMAAAASLLCGNRVVFKPSEKCPSTARLIRRLFREAGFSAPAFEIAEGGEDAAREVVGRDAVRKVIFFGGYETGRDVAALCGRAFKPCVLELGGFGAAIVRPDADLRRAARGLAWSAFYAGGRSCVGTKIAYVHASAADRLTWFLIEEMSRLRSGDPLDPETEVGAAREEELPPELRRFIESRPARGATVRSSGGAMLVVLDALDPVNPPLPGEDLPCPLLVVCPVDSDEEALRAMNRSDFALGASIWSRDMKRARDLAGRLQASLVWINDTSVGMTQAPWGGAKRSGWGRLFSTLALAELTATKVVSVETSRFAKRKFWWFPYSRRKYGLLLAVNAFVYGPKRLKTLLAVLRPRPAYAPTARMAPGDGQASAPPYSTRTCL